MFLAVRLPTYKLPCSCNGLSPSPVKVYVNVKAKEHDLCDWAPQIKVA
jgi:hypothetical protein